MADTTYMKNVVEPWVRTWLTQQFPGHRFSKQFLELNANFQSLVKARQKFLILTHEEMYNDFQKRSQGKIAEGIRILFCELPHEVEEKVASMQVRASKEQKPQ